MVKCALLGSNFGSSPGLRHDVQFDTDLECKARWRRMPQLRGTRWQGLARGAQDPVT
jgi:hypothetical protein